MTHQSVRRLAPLAAALLVLLAVAGTWALLRDDGRRSLGPGSGGAGPVPLRLLALPAAGTGPAGLRYSLASGADLPRGPGSAPVRRVLARDDQAALRAVLGRLAGSLSVQPSGAWSAGALAGSGCGSTAAPPGTPVSSGDPASVGGSGVPCSRSQGLDGGTGPTGTGGGPTRADVLRALGLAGQGAGTVTVVTRPDGLESYAVDPLVGGLPTAGLRTTLVVDGQTVRAGSGWLVSTPVAGDYPVVSAAAAFASLTRAGSLVPREVCAHPEGADPPGCGQRATVTGAELGLALQAAEQGYLLVPAWLFRVAGSGQPLVQLAVPPALLAKGGSAGAGSSGSTGTAVPPLPPPSASAAGPDPTSQFVDVRPRADGRGLDVTFWGGVPACYAYDVQVRETDRQVQLRLLRRPPATPGQVCIEIAQQRRLSVGLAAPLGRRQVVDAETDQVLLGPAR